MSFTLPARMYEWFMGSFPCRFIKVELLDVCGKNYGLTINDLHSAIYPDKCSVKVRALCTRVCLGGGGGGHSLTLIPLTSPPLGIDSSHAN